LKSTSSSRSHVACASLTIRLSSSDTEAGLDVTASSGVAADEDDEDDEEDPLGIREGADSKGVRPGIRLAPGVVGRETCF